MTRIDTLPFVQPFRLTLAILPVLLGCAADLDEDLDQAADVMVAEQVVDSSGRTPPTGSAGAPDVGRGPARGGPQPQSPTRRIVALGDSITETSCTTQLLWKKLRDAGRANFDLVGSRKNQQSCGVDGADRDTEGHSGYLVTDLLPGKPRASELPQWTKANRADVALIHFGTNDVWNNRPVPQILEALTEVIESLRAAQPNVVSFVAQIIPLRPPQNCPDCPSRSAALNKEIPGWASKLSTSESPIYVVDHTRGFDSAKDTHDGVHPNQSGSEKMAEAWFSALGSRRLP